jgi:hypothetical protein
MCAVSIIVPNYNHARFLEARIESILGQTYQDYELLLLDDASTDDSPSVIEKYASDSRVSVHRNTTNSGSPFRQWNKGVALARGELIWIAESDDLAEPTLLEALVGLLQSDPLAVLAYCRSVVIDQGGNKIGTMDEFFADLDAERWQHDFDNDGRNECVRCLLVKNSIPNASAVVFRRSAYNEAGGASEHLRLCGDWVAWARLLARGRVRYTAQPLNYFRAHESTVRSSTSALRQCLELCVVMAEICQLVGPPAKDREHVKRRLYVSWWSVLRNAPEAPTVHEAWRMARNLDEVSRGSGVTALCVYSVALLLRTRLGKGLLNIKRGLGGAAAV